MAIFIIRNKETKETWVSRSGKSFWKTKGAAKNAYICHGYLGSHDTRPYVEGAWNKKVLKFDEQSVFEIIKIKENQDIILDRALELLAIAEGLLHGHSIADEINGFVEKHRTIIFD